MTTLVYPKVLTRTWWSKRKSSSTEKTGIGAEIEKLEKAWAKSPAQELLKAAELELKELAAKANDVKRDLTGLTTFAKSIEATIGAIQAADKKITDKDSKQLLRELLEAAQDFNQEAKDFAAGLVRRCQEAADYTRKRDTLLETVREWVRLAKASQHEAADLMLKFGEECAIVDEDGKTLLLRVQALVRAKKKMDKAEYAKATAASKRVQLAAQRMSQIRNQWNVKAKAFGSPPSNFPRDMLFSLGWSDSEASSEIKLSTTTFERFMSRPHVAACQELDRVLKLVKP